MSPSPLQQAIDDLLRRQTDATNVIETLWRLYAKHVEIPSGGVQWTESRRCFFAGSATMFECFMRIMEPGDEPTQADLDRVTRIRDELDRFHEDLKAGRA